MGSATGVATLGIGVANKDATGAAIGVTGHFVSNATGLLDGAKGLAQNLPVIGQGVAIGGLVWDAHNALKAEGCYGGGK